MVNIHSALNQAVLSAVLQGYVSKDSFSLAVKIKLTPLSNLKVQHEDSQVLAKASIIVCKERINDAITKREHKAT